jgi:hypothetical protein
LGRLLKHTCCLFLLIGGIFQQAWTQDRTFSISGSAGYGLLNLGSVDDKNASDVAGWSSLGIPLGGFTSLKRSPFYSARMTYRSTRDFAVSVYASYFSESVSTSYDGTDAILHLDRSVGATDLALGLAYYPPSQPYFLQWYLQANLGILMAHAAARAIGEQATKPGGVVVMVPLVDSQGEYKKTKTSASFFVGVDLPLLRGFFLNGQAGYRVSQTGQLEGDITRFGVQSSESSTTMFDFSGFLFSLGVGIEL